MGISGKTGVRKRLRHRQIGVVKLHIFSDQTDPDRPVPRVDLPDHLLPLGKIRFRGFDLQSPAYDA